MTSDYIQRVVAGLGDKTDIVMAIDLEGAFGVPRIRRWLDENDIKEIPEKQRDEAARTLGTMKGITLAMTVDQDVTGRATVEFDARRGGAQRRRQADHARRASAPPACASTTSSNGSSPPPASR